MISNEQRNAIISAVQSTLLDLEINDPVSINFAPSPVHDDIANFSPGHGHHELCRSVENPPGSNIFETVCVPHSH